MQALLESHYSTLGDRIKRMLNEPKAGDFWEADHVVAVAEGGGESDLQNFQTLCVPCHAKKSRAQKERSKTEKRKKAAEGTADAAAPGCELEAELDGVARQLQRVQTQMQELLQLAKGSMEQYHVQLQALQLQATEARMLNSEEKLEKALKQHHKVMADQKRQEEQACSTMHTMRRREEELAQRKRLLDAQLAAKVRVRARVRKVRGRVMVRRWLGEP